MKALYSEEMLRDEILRGQGNFNFQVDIVHGDLFPYFGSICFGKRFSKKEGTSKGDIERIVLRFIEDWLEANELRDYQPRQIRDFIFRLGKILDRREEEYLALAQDAKVFEVDLPFCKCCLEFYRVANVLGFNVCHIEKGKPRPSKAEAVLQSLCQEFPIVLTPFLESVKFKMDFNCFRFITASSDSDTLFQRKINEFMKVLLQYFQHVSWKKDYKLIFEGLIQNYLEPDTPKVVIGRSGMFPISVCLLHNKLPAASDDKIWRNGNLSKYGDETYKFRQYLDLALEFTIQTEFVEEHYLSDIDALTIQNEFKTQASLFHHCLLYLCKLRSLEK